jgi:excisionase family DNA binding protein
MTTSPDYLTVDQVAAIVQVTPEAVRRWIRGGELPAYRLGGQRMGYRIARADLDAFIAARQTRR